MGDYVKLIVHAELSSKIKKEELMAMAVKLDRRTGNGLSDSNASIAGVATGTLHFFRR